MAIEELDSELLETALLEDQVSPCRYFHELFELRFTFENHVIEDQVPSTALSRDNQHSLFE